MPRAFSDDLRCRILQAYERGGVSLRELAERFGVSFEYVREIRKQQLRTGRMERVLQTRHGPKPWMTPVIERELRTQLRAQPDLTLWELQQRLGERAGVRWSKSLVWLCLQRLQLRRKKTLHACEQDTELGRLRRQAWWEQVSQIDPQQLVFLDESGVTTEMTRRYGRALRGERVREGAPAGHWHTLTLLGAISLDGLMATMTIESPTDSDVFVTYVEQVLCPRLRPGQVVVMDNLSAHKNPSVRECIEQTGARLLYLPPYSPDFNPIEQCWAKIKEHLRSAKARLLDVLDQAVTAAIAAVTAQNAAAWFHHSGYGVR